MACFAQYSICPVGVISRESFNLIEIYKSIDGFKRLQTPEQYMDQLDYYVEAFKVIDNEIGLLDRRKKVGNG